MAYVAVSWSARSEFLSWSLAPRAGAFLPSGQGPTGPHRDTSVRSGLDFGLEGCWVGKTEWFGWTEAFIEPKVSQLISHFGPKAEIPARGSWFLTLSDWALYGPYSGPL